MTSDRGKGRNSGPCLAHALPDVQGGLSAAVRRPKGSCHPDRMDDGWPAPWIGNFGYQVLPGPVLYHWGGASGAQKVLYIPRPSHRQPFKVKIQETPWQALSCRGETRVPIVPYPTPNTYNYKGDARELLPSEKGTRAAPGSPTQSLLPSDIHS